MTMMNLKDESKSVQVTPSCKNVVVLFFSLLPVIPPKTPVVVMLVLNMSHHGHESSQDIAVDTPLECA